MSRNAAVYSPPKLLSSAQIMSGIIRSSSYPSSGKMASLDLRTCKTTQGLHDAIQACIDAHLSLDGTVNGSSEALDRQIGALVQVVSSSRPEKKSYLRQSAHGYTVSAPESPHPIASPKTTVKDYDGDLTQSKEVQRNEATGDAVGDSAQNTSKAHAESSAAQHIAAIKPTKSGPKKRKGIGQPTEASEPKKRAANSPENVSPASDPLPDVDSKAYQDYCAFYKKIIRASHSRLAGSRPDLHHPHKLMIEDLERRYDINIMGNV
ncbi:MAG: hypothetical protein M1828_006531 [Chrysothrix sp. TS-e1954]|nr:MAG: hypothetical protein M1828_006531 [Chrysothrix sp. TS-e1954]